MERYQSVSPWRSRGSGAGSWNTAGSRAREPFPGRNRPRQTAGAPSRTKGA